MKIEFNNLSNKIAFSCNQTPFVSNNQAPFACNQAPFASNQIPFVFNPTPLSVISPEIKNDTFDKSSRSSFEEIINIISSAPEEIKQEILMSFYIKCLLAEPIQDLLKQEKYREFSIDSLDPFIRKLGGDEQTNKIFEKSKVKNLGQLQTFLKLYTSNPQIREIYKGQNIEAVKIYGILENKKNLINFPETSLVIFLDQENCPKPQYDILNVYYAVLNELGVEKESDIEEKFSYLKSSFNNLETATDKVNLVYYIAITFRPKKEMLAEILKANPELKELDETEVYNYINDVVNYLYEKNDGKNLGNLSFFIDVLLNGGKIKQERKAYELFGPFSEVENKIDFYTLLKECNVSIDDFNKLTKPTIVSDSSLLDVLIYKEQIVKEMKQLGIGDEARSKEIYLQFSQILTAVFTQGDNQENIDALDTVLKIIDKYKIKNQFEFLNFYNKIYFPKERKLTTEQICTLVDLFKFDDESNIFETARQLNKKPQSILVNKKENFARREQAINEFLESASSEAFIGKLAFDVYKELPFLMKVSPEKIFESLTLADESGIYDKESDKLEEKFKKFENYFPSKKDTLSFIKNSQIKFDDSEDSTNYRNACLKISEALYDRKNPKQSAEKMQNLAKSGFLTKSKQSLPDFVSAMESLGLLREISDVIITKEIPSVKVLNNFLKKYETHPDNHSNLIKHILTIPDNINFNQYTDFIQKLCERISSFQIDTSINNDNILNIDINKYYNKRVYSASDKNELLCAVLGEKTSEKSFVNLLKKSYTDEKPVYNAYKIAKEIANKINSSEESYKNISDELGLDMKSLGLDNNCPQNIYIKEIAKKLPPELINFVNSNEWVDFNNDGNLPNLILHSRLRLIDRFALSDNKTIKDLNSKETVANLKDVLKSIYMQMPIHIEGRSGNKKILIQTPYKNQKIESIFDNEGRLITAIEAS